MLICFGIWTGIGSDAEETCVVRDKCGQRWVWSETSVVRMISKVVSCHEAVTE